MILQNVFNSIMELEKSLQVSGVAVCIEPSTGLMQFSLLLHNEGHSEVVFLEVPIDEVGSITIEEFKQLFYTELAIHKSGLQSDTLH